VSFESKLTHFCVFAIIIRMLAKSSIKKRGMLSPKDSPQVCLGLVTTREGLPIAFEIFDCNRSDVTTTREMVEIMDAKYGQANRIWVVDRGMVSEENLEYLRARGARYLVGTPKSLLKKFERQLLEQSWEKVEPGVEVKLCRSPEGRGETFVLCRSVGRKEKKMPS